MQEQLNEIIRRVEELHTYCMQIKNSSEQPTSVENRFEISCSRVLSDVIEGGFVDHPEDNGGPTNRGVTLNTARQVYGPDYSVNELMNLTENQAKGIYKSLYWNPVCADQLAVGIDCFVFDCAVHSGVGQASRWLQRVVGAAEDGKVGPITIEKHDKFVKTQGPVKMLQYLVDRRMSFLRSLSDWEHFGKGWTNRVEMMYEWCLGDIHKHSV